jgi:5-methylcytosine-specific restriction endonuclease McrA
MTTLAEIVITLSNNFTKIIARDQLEKYKELNWGNNGVGDRWANKKYNYSVVYANHKTKLYSENDEDAILPEVLDAFICTNQSKRGNAIVGIFVYSPRINVVLRCIKKTITCQPCVICGTTTEIICDHKNDLYDDQRVLNTSTQSLNDFQPLCNHCNLRKRQIVKHEKDTQKRFTVKMLPQYKYEIYPFLFPWEQYAYGIGRACSYWYDPVEFQKKIFMYTASIMPIVKEIKKNVTLIN